MRVNKIRRNASVFLLTKNENLEDSQNWKIAKLKNWKIFKIKRLAEYIAAAQSYNLTILQSSNLPYS